MYKRQVYLVGGKGDDTINISNATGVSKSNLNHRFDGDSGNDQILGNSEGNRLIGGRDSDQLEGGGGNDLIYGNTTYTDVWSNSSDYIVTAVAPHISVCCIAINKIITTPTF